MEGTFITLQEDTSESPDKEIDLFSLDAEKINQSFEAFVQSDPKFHLLGAWKRGNKKISNNYECCSSLTYTLLCNGGMTRRYEPLHIEKVGESIVKGTEDSAKSLKLFTSSAMRMSTRTRNPLPMLVVGVAWVGYGIKCGVSKLGQVTYNYFSNNDFDSVVPPKIVIEMAETQRQMELKISSYSSILAELKKGAAVGEKKDQPKTVTPKVISKQSQQASPDAPLQTSYSLHHLLPSLCSSIHNETKIAQSHDVTTETKIEVIANFAAYAMHFRNCCYKKAFQKFQEGEYRNLNQKIQTLFDQVFKSIADHPVWVYFKDLKDGLDKIKIYFACDGAKFVENFYRKIAENSDTVMAPLPINQIYVPGDLTVDLHSFHHLLSLHFKKCGENSLRYSFQNNH